MKKRKALFHDESVIIKWSEIAKGSNRTPQGLMNEIIKRIESNEIKL